MGVCKLTLRINLIQAWPDVAIIYSKKKNVQKNSREELLEEEFLNKGSVLQTIFFNYVKALCWDFEN